MSRLERAERWILSHCSETDDVARVDFSEADLPDGVTLGLLKAAFRRLKQAGRVDGGVIVSDPLHAAEAPA